MPPGQLRHPSEDDFQKGRPRAGSNDTQSHTIQIQYNTNNPIQYAQYIQYTYNIYLVHHLNKNNKKKKKKKKEE